MLLPSVFRTLIITYVYKFDTLIINNLLRDVNMEDSGVNTSRVIVLVRAVTIN
jgi:hypothetical protein